MGAPGTRISWSKVLQIFLGDPIIGFRFAIFGRLATPPPDIDAKKLHCDLWQPPIVAEPRYDPTNAPKACTPNSSNIVRSDKTNGFETLVILQAFVSVVAALKDAVGHVSELLVLVTLVTLVTLMVMVLVRVCDVCNTTKTDPC